VDIPTRDATSVRVGLAALRSTLSGGAWVIANRSSGLTPKAAAKSGTFAGDGCWLPRSQAATDALSQTTTRLAIASRVNSAS
jgi:hypothetical protein